MKVAGLSIEDSHIRVSIVSKRLGATKAIHSEDIALPEAAEQRNALIREALLKWKKDYGIKGIVLGIDFKDFSHHFIELPLRSRTDIGRALAFEMEKHLPLPPDEYLFDFHVIERKKEGTKSLILSIRKERLTWIDACLKDTGIQLLSVRCSLIAAMNGLIASGKREDVIFIYPRGRLYHIAGMRGSEPHYLRVADQKDLMLEIEKLQEVFTKGIYMAGNIPSALNIFNIKGLPFSIPYLIALSAFGKSHIDLNFLPGEFVARRIDYYPYAAGIMAALSVMLYLAGDFYAYYKDKAALKAVEARISEIKQTAKGLIETKKEIEDIEERKKFLMDFQGKANINIKTLRGLSIVLPEDVWLTDFSSGAGKVEIKGFAKRAVSIIEPLEMSAMFKNVEFSSPITKKDDTERFSLKMEVEQ